MNKTFAFIFARGGSKGLPNKNILPIGGIPMIAHAINLARDLAHVQKIFVSTDSTDIADISIKYGAEIIHRPAYLASDTASEWDAWSHAIKEVRERYGEFDIFLSLPPTAPIRRLEDVQKCINALAPGIDCAFVVTKAHRNPWFNMVKYNESGLVEKIVDSSIHIQRRQSAPECFDMTTVAYSTRPDYVLSSRNMWDGNVSAVEIPVEYSIDIDTPLDFAIAQFLLENWIPKNCLK